MSKHNFNRNFAIIIGINDYTNGIRKLETAVPDAQKLAQIIEGQHLKLQQRYQADNKYEVLLILDQSATLDKLSVLIEYLKKGQIPFNSEKVTVTENDRVLFYFAGHGIAKDALEHQDGPVGYLIPQDAKSDDKDGSTFLPMQELNDALNALPCKHMLAILDCCFAGAFRWASLKRQIVAKSKVYKERYDRFISDAAWQVITSSAADQTAIDYLGSRRTPEQASEFHSPFAKALFDALSGKNADPDKDSIITATELYLYVRNQVEISTKNQYKRQTPSLYPLKKHDKGEFIFLLPNFDRDKLDDAPALNLNNNPYRGLESYDEKHSSLFFGRNKLKDKLCQIVVANKQPFTLVLGASGTGKSSLMKAGLLSYLRNCQEPKFEILKPIRPGENPLKALAPILPVAITAEELAKNEQALANVIEHWCNKNPHTRLLLPIDQFEELITLCKSDEEKEQFQKLIRNALNKFPQNIHIVVTLRLDFEAQFQNSILKDFWNHDTRFIITPMSQNEFREAIEKPASAKVMYFDPPSLVDELINEVVQMPGALPLLSFTLSELYLKYVSARRDNRALTKKDYEELGGVVGSLTKRADQEYEKLVAENPAYIDTVRRVMLRLISLQGGELARRQVPKSELEYPDQEENKRVQTVITRFSKARLIVEDSNSEDKPCVEPAHDALVNGWAKLRNWINNNRERLALQQKLTPVALEWATNKRESGYLWTEDPRLAVLEKIIEPSTTNTAADNWLNQLEKDFVLSSIQQRQDELKKAEENLAEAYWQNLTKARKDNQRIEAMHWAARTASLHLTQTKRKSSILALSNFLQSTYLEVMTEGFAEAEVIGYGYFPTPPVAILSKNEDRILVWFVDGIARVWNVQDSLPITAPIKHDYKIYGVVFTDDGKKVLTWGGRDRLMTLENGSNVRDEIRLWDVEQDRLIGSLMHHDDLIGGASFNKNETKILSWGGIEGDRIVKLWSVDTSLLGCSLEHECDVVYAQLVEDEKKILTVDALARFYLWDISMLSSQPEGREIAKYEISLASAISTYFTIVSWKENQFSIRDRSSYKDLVIEVQIHDEILIAMRELFNINVDSYGALNRSENQIITWDGVGTQIRLFDLSSKKQIAVIDQGGKVEEAIFNYDGSRILSWSGFYEDYQFKLWSSADGSSIGNVIPGFEAAFSPSGQYLATFTKETVTLWNSSDGTQALATIQHSSYVKENLIFSKREDRFLSWHGQGGVIVTSFKDGTPEWQILNHDAYVYHASFNKDETKVLTTSGNGTVRLWNVGSQFCQSLRLPHPATVQGTLEDRDQKRILTWSTWSVRENAPMVVRLWNSLDGTPITPEMKHGEIIDDYSYENQSLTGESFGGCCFSHDQNSILTWSGDGTVRLWSASDGSSLVPPIKHSACVVEAVFSPDGRRILSYAKDGSASIWDAATGKELVPPMKHKGTVAGAIFNRDATKILTWDYHTVRLWDAATGNPLTSAMKHEEAGEEEKRKYMVVGAKFDTEENRILSWSRDKTVRLWNAHDGSLLTPPMQHDEALKGATFSSDGEKILTWTWCFSSWGGTPGAAQVWQASNGSPLTRPMLHKKGVNGAMFYAQETRILTWSQDGAARIWNSSDGSIVATLKHETILTGSETGKDFAKLSRDEQTILTWGDDQTARLWSAIDGKPIAPPMVHDSSVLGAIFSEDERWVLTWSEDNTIRLWNTDDGSPVTEPFRHWETMSVEPGYSENIKGAKFFRGDTCVVGWTENTVQIWKLEANYDFPYQLIAPLVEVATGTVMERAGNIRFLDRDEWLTRRAEYLKKGACNIFKINV
jgi:WD40 repeat protein